jgi:transcriptional regulator with XRE-family HTH domain
MIQAGSHIYATLKAARQAKGLSQRALSESVGMPQSHISKIEQGTVDLQMSSLLSFARALDIEIMLVPRKLVPAVEAITKTQRDSSDASPAVRPAYTLDEDADA